jgi:hypothetical protein
MVDPRRIKQAKEAREWRDSMGSKFMRAEFDPPIQEFLNCTASAAYLRGANGGGKSYALAWLVTAHALGRYPANYVGWKPKLRETDPYQVTILVMSQSAQVLRDSMQRHLLGDVAGGQDGTGMIPKASIVKIERTHGVAGSVDYCIIKRDDGTLCQIFFRSFEQQRISIQGIRAAMIAIDELFNDDDLLGELVGRMVGRGILRVAATERFQQSSLAMWFAEDPINRPIFHFSMDQISHVTDAEKQEFLASLPENERQARYYGQAFSGGGNVWQVPIENILTDEPDQLHSVDTRYLISLDLNHFGQSGTGSKFAALYWALPSRYPNVAFLFDEITMYGSIADQAAALLDKGARGIPIAWPHDGQQGQANGQSIIALFKNFRDLRFHNTWSTLNAQPGAGYGLEDGIALANTMMQRGQLKVLRSLVEFRREFVRYERGEDGKPIAKNDDLMSALRIGAMMLKIARPVEDEFNPRTARRRRGGGGSYMDPDVSDRFWGM